MRIGIIGSGVVAQTLGSKLIGQGHDLILGTRDPNKLDDKKMFGATLREWKSQTEGRGRIVEIATFKEAAAQGELLANELDHSKGMPPRVLASQETSEVTGRRGTACPCPGSAPGWCSTAGW
jgi:hypothetical protein